MTHADLDTTTTDPPEGYRLTELGSLPAHWRVVRLGEVFSLVLKQQRAVRIEEAQSYRLLTVRLYAKGVVLRSTLQGSRIGTKILYQTQPGDFVFSKIDARNGAWGFVDVNLVGGLVSGDFPIMRLDREKADQDFLELLLSQPSMWEPLRNVAVGTTNRRRVQPKQLLSLPIPLPPLAEQRAIAHVLRTVQRAKEATEGVLVALRELKKSLMRHLFTYGPVPLDQTDRVPMQETEIGPLPAHWRVVRLEEVVGLRKGTVSPLEVPQARYVGLEHIDSGEITIRRFGYATDVKSAKAVFHPGDILYGKLRPYLEKAALAQWTGVCSTDILVLIPEQKQADPSFCAYLMHSPYVLQHAIATTTGVNHPRTSWKALSQGLIPLPPLSEQQEIARILQAVDRKMEAEEGRKQALEALFKTLLHDLMTARRRLPAEFIARFAEGTGDE